MDVFGLLHRALLALVLSVVVAMPGFAQQQSQNFSILTINQDLLFSASLYGERVRDEIEAEKTRLEIAIRQIESDLVAEEKSLTEQRATLPNDEFRKLADAFDQKVQGIRSAQKTKAQNLGRKLDQERAGFYKRVLPVLGELMKERGAMVVLDQRTVFASASSVDITEIAVRRIDATIGDGTGEAVPPEPQE